MRRDAAAPLSATFLFLGGFTGWALAFVVLYALLSFGCTYGWDTVPFGPMSLNRAVLLAAWVLSLAGLAALLWASVRLFTAKGEDASPFLRVAGVALSGLALLSTVWNFAMVATLSTCL